MKVYRLLYLLGGLALVPGCSGDKDEATDEVQADAKDAKDASETAAAAPEAPAAPAAVAEAPAAPQPPARVEVPPAPEKKVAAPAPEDPFAGTKVTRYVRVVAIKIHTTPDKASPTVGWVKHGQKVDVVIAGEWAKLEDGKFISSKFLVEDPPKPLPKGYMPKGVEDGSKAGAD